MSEEIDIQYIIQLVREQEPVRQDLIDALQKSKNGYWSSNGYYQFVNSSNVNNPGSEWQHEDCIVLEPKDKGDIVIDLLKDGTVGGIEFINLIDK